MRLDGRVWLCMYMAGGGGDDETTIFTYLYLIYVLSKKHTFSRSRAAVRQTHKPKIKKIKCNF